MVFMEFFRRLFARLRGRQSSRQTVRPPVLPLVVIYSAPIYREVTRNSVRVFSLCGSCGTRLEASATLCEDCAQKQSRQARPF